MARWATHRTDNGSKALAKYAEDLGFVVHAEGGTIDAYLALGTKIAGGGVEVTGRHLKHDGSAV